MDSNNDTHVLFPHYSGGELVEVSGIGSEEGCYRRDNSNVIRADGWYYVYYNKGPAWEDFLTGWRGSVWGARSRDGLRWEEVGEMVPRGPEGRWDAWATYCPNILVGSDGRYYLYFTGQPECQKAETPIHIGVAVSDSPEGPFQRCQDEPVFSPTGDDADTDGWRVDDASVIPRDGRYWMYYKGRGYGREISETTIGLACADSPAGPWERYEDNPVIDGGHEIMVWPHREGVAVYAWSHVLDGPEDRADIYWAPDGIDFRRVFSPEPLLRNPGGYFPDCYADPAFGHGGSWGISFISASGQEYLTRFEMDLRADENGERRL
jgi:hypothetical protein